MLNALELIQKIETAFANVKRVEKTLEQSFITDEYGLGDLSKKEFEKIYHKAKENRPYDNWTDISDELIETYYSPFSNMSNEEFTFYLPAYMRYVIKHLLKNPQKNWWDNQVLVNIAWYLGLPREYKALIHLYATMTDQQKGVILDYCNFIVDLTYNTIKDEDFFENSRKKFWHEYHLETILRAKNRLFFHFYTLT